MLHNLLNTIELMSQAELRVNCNWPDLVFPFYFYSFRFLSIILNIRGNMLLEMSDKVTNSDSQPVGCDSFGGQMTLSQRSPKTIRRHRYFHFNS